MALMEKLIGTELNGSTVKNTVLFKFTDPGNLVPDAGKALLAIVRCGSSNNINTALGSNGVTDTKGGTWSVLGGSAAYASGANVYALVCHACPTYTSTDTLTFNLLNNNQYLSVVIGQWPHGVFATVDGSVHVTTGASGTTRSAPAVTPTVANEEIITAFGNGQTISGTTSLQAGSAFTLCGASINCGLAEITTLEAGPTFSAVTGAWQATQSTGSSALAIVFEPSVVVSADAGPDQVAGLGETVTVSGAITGTGATAAWLCLSGPSSGATHTGTSFSYLPSALGSDVWQLTATDSGSNTATDTMTVEVAANVVLVCTGTAIRVVRAVTLKPDGSAV